MKGKKVCGGWGFPSSSHMRCRRRYKEGEVYLGGMDGRLTPTSKTNYSATIFSACGPFLPSVISNSTF